MIRLDKSLHAWGSPDFKAVLKQEIECVDGDLLPLQQGLKTGNYAVSNQFTVMINSVSDTENHIHVTAGILYKSVIAGCSCADDPTPVNENSEYCVVRLVIDKSSAVTAVSLVTE